VLRGAGAAVVAQAGPRCAEADSAIMTFSEAHELIAPRMKLTSHAVAWAADALAHDDTTVSALAVISRSPGTLPRCHPMPTPSSRRPPERTSRGRGDVGEHHQKAERRAGPGVCSRARCVTDATTARVVSGSRKKPSSSVGWMPLTRPSSSGRESASRCRSRRDLVDGVDARRHRREVNVDVPGWQGTTRLPHHPRSRSRPRCGR
jgi:hypothetical protein